MTHATWIWIEHPLIPQSRTRVLQRAFELVYEPRGYVLDTDQGPGGETMANSFVDEEIAAIIGLADSLTRAALEAIGLGGGLGTGEVDSVNGVGPDVDGNVVLTPEDIGAQPAGDYLDPSGAATLVGAELSGKADITDERFSDARVPLGHSHAVDDLSVSGTADDTTFLRGDGVWAIPPGVEGSGPVTFDDLPAGSVLYNLKAAGVWPARPTARTDVMVLWKGADPAPTIGGTGMVNGLDEYHQTP